MRRLRITREGKYFIGLTLAIGFAAINTGNNLLYLVLGMLLALIVASGILSEIVLQDLVVERRVPGRVHVGQPVLIGIELRNGKRRWSSFSIEVEDLLDGVPLDKKCYFLKVPAGRTQRTAYRQQFARRGLQRFSELRIGTRFPFALFHKWRRFADVAELLVYPAVHPVSPTLTRSIIPGDQRAERLGRRGEFHGLRDFRDGDDPSDIYWRKSARLGRALIRQTENPTGRQLLLFLDNRGPAALAPEDLDRREQLVSDVASLAAHYINAGFAVGLVTRTASVLPAAGLAHLDALLRALALLDFIEDDRPYESPRHWRGDCLFIGPQGVTPAAGPPPRPAPGVLVRT